MQELGAVITGFEPFAGSSDNASWEAVRRLPQEVELAGDAHLTLHIERLPVTFEGAATRVRDLVAEVDPQILVHVGLDAKAPAIKLETTAYNEATASIPDNAGAQPKHEQVVAGAPAARHSTWHAPVLTGRLAAAGFPVVTSNDAGRYVCNTTLYTALDALGENPRRPTGFVHVPQASTVETGVVVRTLEALLVELADQVRRQEAYAAGKLRSSVARPARPFRIGLTGGVGSGKSTVARMLAERGAVLVDADEIARAIVEPGQPAFEDIRQAFGEKMIREDGSLDRRALASVVFADTIQRTKLDGITLPRIARTAAERMEAAGPGNAAIYDVPLLTEGGMADLFDAVLVVTAPTELRLERLEARGMSRADALARMENQASDEQRLAIADLVIVNDGGLAELDARVREVARELGL